MNFYTGAVATALMVGAFGCAKTRDAQGNKAPSPVTPKAITCQTGFNYADYDQMYQDLETKTQIRKVVTNLESTSALQTHLPDALIVEKVVYDHEEEHKLAVQDCATGTVTKFQYDSQGREQALVYSISAIGENFIELTRNNRGTQSSLRVTAFGNRTFTEVESVTYSPEEVETQTTLIRIGNELPETETLKVGLFSRLPSDLPMTMELKALLGRASRDNQESIDLPIDDLRILSMSLTQWLLGNSWAAEAPGSARVKVGKNDKFEATNRTPTGRVECSLQNIGGKNTLTMNFKQLNSRTGRIDGHFKLETQLVKPLEEITSLAVSAQDGVSSAKLFTPSRGLFQLADGSKCLLNFESAADFRLKGVAQCKALKSRDGDKVDVQADFNCLVDLKADRKN